MDRSDGKTGNHFCASPGPVSERRAHPRILEPPWIDLEVNPLAVHVGVKVIAAAQGLHAARRWGRERCRSNRRPSRFILAAQFFSSGRPGPSDEENCTELGVLPIRTTTRRIVSFLRGFLGTSGWLAS
jgi:hypothetical protein